MTSDSRAIGQQIVVWPDNRVEVGAFEIPVPGPGEVLIETTRTLISAGTELGTQELTRDSPFTPGYSNIGHILSVGDGVLDYKIGDRVLSMGGHASHVVSSTLPWHLRPVPERLTDEEATFGVLGSVAMHGARRGRIEFGEHALVTGMGLVGQLALRLATAIGTETLTAVDLVDERLQKAAAGGASHTVNPGKADLKAEVDRITEGRGLDVVIEASGYPDLLPMLFDLCRIGGRIVLLGSIWRRKVAIDFMDFHLRELTLIGCHQPKCPIHPTSAFPWTQQYNRGQFLAMMADNRLDVKPLISHRLPYSEMNEAYRLLREERSQSLGVVLEW